MHNYENEVLLIHAFSSLDPEREGEVDVTQPARVSQLLTAWLDSRP